MSNTINGLTYYTKQELIDAWLLRYPTDIDCPDLEHNALGGYVHTVDGFIEYTYYPLRIKRQETPS